MLVRLSLNSSGTSSLVMVIGFSLRAFIMYIVSNYPVFC